MLAIFVEKKTYRQSPVNANVVEWPEVGQLCHLPLANTLKSTYLSQDTTTYFLTKNSSQ